MHEVLHIRDQVRFVAMRRAGGDKRPKRAGIVPQPVRRVMLLDDLEPGAAPRADRVRGSTYWIVA
jgi:hypothetical protein